MCSGPLGAGAGSALHGPAVFALLLDAVCRAAVALPVPAEPHAASAGTVTAARAQPSARDSATRAGTGGA